MNNTDVDFNLKRDFSDVINVTFSFIKQEFKTLLSTVALYTIIPLLGSAVLSVFYTKDTWTAYFQGIFTNAPVVETPNFTVLILMIVINFISTLMVMGLTYEYIHLYNTRGKGNFTRADVANAFVKDFLKILGYNIIVFIVVTLASVLIIPGIYLAVPLTFITIILIVEKKGFSDSWSRCFEIIKNNWWFTLALIIVTYIIIYMLGMVFNLPLGIYSGIKGFTAATGGNFEMDYVVLTLFTILSTVGSSLLMVLFYTMLAAQYYSLNSDKTKASSILDRINEIEDRPVEDSF
nr:hypothetical protein [uncultured Carboxylicivirga sp.]